MRLLLLIILLLPFAFCFDHGKSQVLIERIWAIGAPSESSVSFRGALAANNSNQQVISVNASKDAFITSDEDGIVWVNYKGESTGGDIWVSAKALVEVDYTPAIRTDHPVPMAPLPADGSLQASWKLPEKASELSDADSTLKTIASLVNFVNGYIEYDESYWDRELSAAEIFLDGKGVCVQYSMLLVSLAESVGIESRFVSGYVKTSSWQPHVWVEHYIPGYGWLSADPTFGELGDLDSTHLATNFGKSPAELYDELLTSGNDSSLSAEYKATLLSIQKNGRKAVINISSGNEPEMAEVRIYNPTDTYLLGKYSFSALSIVHSEVFVIEPAGNITIKEKINDSFSGTGKRTIEATASFNDAVSKGTVESPPQSCLSILALLLPGAYLLKTHIGDN